jgi:hypothetical protein
MRKIILGFVAAAAIATPVVGIAGSASADVSNNGTLNDRLGYCNANHIANFNGDENGIGHLRSQQTGAQISATNHNLPDFCDTTQGDFSPVGKGK